MAARRKARSARAMKARLFFFWCGSWFEKCPDKIHIMRVGGSEQFCGQRTTVPYRPACCQGKIIIGEVLAAAFKSPPDIGDGNIVPTHAHALAHACDGLSRCRKPQVMKFDLITLGKCASQQPEIVRPLKVLSSAKVAPLEMDAWTS